MREILFRGKRKDIPWEYGGFVCLEDGVCIIDPLTEIETYVDEETVGQYTGLTDKNGKRIFEGDILKLGTGKTRFVFYGVSSFKHTIYNGYAKEFDSKDKGYEVIGNIHDNPELLKDGADN